MNSHPSFKFSFQHALFIALLPFSLLACNSADDDQGSQGGESQSSGGSAGQSSGGSAGQGSAGSAGQAAGGTAGINTGGNGPECPAEAPDWSSGCPQGGNPNGCTYSAVCSSGETNSFHFTCSNNGTDDSWDMAPQPCDHQLEYCGPLPVYCFDGNWRQERMYSVPPQCPDARPDVDSACTPNDGSCGFPCPDGSGWTVLSCTDNTWVSDGACD